MARKSKIDNQGDPVLDEEVLMRLLCSPKFYDSVTGLVNPDAFDLRIFGNMEMEEYVSLFLKNKSIENGILEEHIQFGYKVSWPEANSYSGYGKFRCGDAREVHSMVEINPVKGKDKTHVGLFYRKSPTEYYLGPLPKDNPEVLQTLCGLADLLEVTKI